MNPTDLLAQVPAAALWIAAGVVAAALALYGLWRLKRLAAAHPAEESLTVAVAAIATGVSAQGMWKFAGDVLGFNGPLRVLLFAFIELAVIASAVRARRNMRDNHSAGIDGVAVWVLTCLTAVLSAMDAHSTAEAVFRLAAPLVAAWLWERGMAVERRRITGLAGINWRLTPERVLVRLGLAEARDRTASEVDAHRRLTRVALAAKRVHQLRESGASDRKVRAAIARRDRALDLAVEHTELARDRARQAALLDLVTTLGGGDSLTGVLATAAAPWSDLDHPAITGAVRDSEAVALAGELRAWTASADRARDGDPEVHAAITSMAAYITGNRVVPASPEVTAWTTALTPAGRPEPVADPITDAVVGDDQDSDQDHDRDDDADTPSEQDNRAAEEWIRRRCRGTSGVGRRPTQRETAEAHGRSVGWARTRIAAVQERMTAQGYDFRPDGVVVSPRRAVTAADAVEAPAVTMNGVEK